MKRIFGGMLIASVFFLVLCILLPVVLGVDSGDSVGIIGGADGPTASFLTWRLMRQLFEVLPMLFGTIAVCSLFCIAFSKSIKEGCTLKISAVSLGLSATFSLGVYCALSVAVCLAFGDIDRHPIRIPVGVAAGAICLIVFLLLAWRYVKLRQTHLSRRGIVFDVLFAMLCAAPFFGTWTLLDSWISAWI